MCVKTAQEVIPSLHLTTWEPKARFIPTATDLSHLCIHTSDSYSSTLTLCTGTYLHTNSNHMCVILKVSVVLKYNMELTNTIISTLAINRKDRERDSGV